MAGVNGVQSTFQPDAPGQKLRTHQSQVGSAPAYEYDPPPPFTNEGKTKTKHFIILLGG